MGWACRFSLATALMFTASAAAAEDHTICADRPGKTTSPCTVPAGHFQVETAFADYTLQKTAGERDTLLTIGETTFKYGVSDNTDIELDVTPWARGTSRSGSSRSSVSGIGDTNVIIKHEFTSSDAPLQISAFPFLKIPTARRPAGNGKVEGGLVIPIEYSIPRSPFSITASPEIDWLENGDGHGHHAAMVQAVSFGWQATDKLNVSAEIYEQWDWEPSGTQAQSSFDVAGAYVIRRDLQIDGGVNLGIDRTAPDVELYAGIAKQF
jgi:hypothetical protein